MRTIAMEKMSKADLEKEEILNPEKAEKRRRRKKKARIMAVVTVICVILVVCCTGFIVVRAMGKNSIMSKATSPSPSLSTDLNVMDKVEQWQDGWVGYNGKVYEYNDDIMTFLVLGIDKKSTSPQTGSGISNSQADAIYLVVMNPHTKKVDLIAVNRDTIADVDVYSQPGAYANTIKTQIALQYTYGDGKAKSAQLMEKAVSKLFYQLPIHGYVAISMDAIPTINDTIGGVEVQCLQDLTEVDPLLKQGESLKLEGQSAFWYVKYKDVNASHGSSDRLERQTQYIQSFVGQAKSAFKADVAMPLTLFKKLSPYMVTDIKADEVTYLVSTAAAYKFSGEVHNLAGESKTEEGNEAFYVDDSALYQLVIDLFYNEVPQ